ncbi:hypothetical protein [Streptomyces sp. NPDC001948]
MRGAESKADIDQALVEKADTLRPVAFGVGGRPASERRHASAVGEPEFESGVIDRLFRSELLDSRNDFSGQSGQSLYLDTAISRVIAVRLRPQLPGGLDEVISTPGEGKQSGREFHEVAAQQHHQGAVVSGSFICNTSGHRVVEDEPGSLQRAADRTLVADGRNIGDLAGRQRIVDSGLCREDVEEGTAGAATSHVPLREVRSMGFDDDGCKSALLLQDPVPD